MALCFSFGLFAQSFQGGVRGTVTDEGGAAIPGAKVALVEVGTNVTRNTVTNDAGEYVFNAVNPSGYKLVSEYPGFKKLERAVDIGTQQFITVDLSMQVGEVTESIQVTEEVPLIETSNASTGQTVDRQKLVDLPNLGRNPFMMSRISANVQQVGNPRFNRMQDQSGSSQISIAGGPVRGNNYLIDGIPITDSVNRAVIIPTIESVEEVKIQANTYDAEMGRTGGGVFNTYMKSGSNDLHGSAFGYLRETAWSANNFFNNRAGIDRPEVPFQNFGASLGGPIFIPKVYDGREKTFFWLGYEGYNQTSADSSRFSLPTAEERVGDFSQSRNVDGTARMIYDPNTTMVSGGTFSRSPFANNRIPTSRISQFGSVVANTFPNPTDASARYGANNYTANATLADTADQFTAKLDHQVTNWWRSSVSYLWYHSLEPGENWFQTVSSPSQWTLDRTVNATQFNNLFTPDPTTVITVRYGFNRFPNDSSQFSAGYNLAQLGLPGSYISQVQSPTFPNITFQTLANLGTNSNGQTIFHSRNFMVGVSKFLGRHSLKAGFDYRRINNDGLDYGNSAGAFSFDDTFTRRTQVADGVSGADMASLLLGLPASGDGNRAIRVEQFVDYFAGYVHDDFRLNGNVTVNFGVRYEYETGMQGVDDAMIVGFDRAVVSPLLVTNPNSGVTPRGGVMYAGQNGYPTQTGNLNALRLSPRGGIAWKLNDKTTVRGGYGLFWAPVAYGRQSIQGFTQTTPVLGSADGGASAGVTMSNPFPNGLLAPIGNGAGLLASVGQNLTFIDNNMRAPYVHQFSFDVQREVGAGIALAVGYVGSRSSNLTLGNAVNINQLEPINFGQGNALTTTVANPYFAAGSPGFLGQQNMTLSQFLRPFNQYGALRLGINSLGYARYDSLVLKAQRRLRNGLSFVSAFTYSRNMDTGVGAVGSSLNAASTAIQNAYDVDREYSLSINDVASRWTNAITYELPFGKGKPFANSTLADLVVGGWSINAVQTWQGGFPIAIRQSANNNAVLGTLVQYPNATGVAPGLDGSVGDRVNGRWLDLAAFDLAPRFSFGNTSRTISTRGPGQHNWDMSIFKTFTIAEKYKAQFRAEAMNAFNTPLFRSPDGVWAPNRAQFGQVTSQANFARLIQLGVRFYF